MRTCTWAVRTCSGQSQGVPQALTHHSPARGIGWMYSTFCRTESRCFLLMPECRQAALRLRGRPDTCRWTQGCHSHSPHTGGPGGGAAYLVIHERQQGRDDERKAGAAPGEQQGRQLVAQGLACTGGQHQQGGHTWEGEGSAPSLLAFRPSLAPLATLTRQDPHDGTFLSRAEGLVAKLLQGLVHLSGGLCGYTSGQQSLPPGYPGSQVQALGQEVGVLTSHLPRGLHRVKGRHRGGQAW